MGEKRAVVRYLLRLLRGISPIVPLVGAGLLFEPLRWRERGLTGAVHIHYDQLIARTLHARRPVRTTNGRACMQSLAA